MSDDLVIERSLAAGVTEVRLNRPGKKNALSIAVRDLLSDALDRAAQDHSVSVVVIAANGDTFSAGFDLGEFAAAAEDPDLDKALWASSDRYHHRLLSFPLPILAAVNGAALAGGFDLATMCDIRVASKSARFARPESSFGPIMYSPLHDMVGSAIARDLSFSGRSVQAEEALRLGLVSRVVDDAELDAEVATLASHIAATPRDLLLNHKAKMIARAGIGDTLAL